MIANLTVQAVTPACCHFPPLACETCNKGPTKSGVLQSLRVEVKLRPKTWLQASETLACSCRTHSRQPSALETLLPLPPFYKKNMSRWKLLDMQRDMPSLARQAGRQGHNFTCFSCLAALAPHTKLLQFRLFDIPSSVGFRMGSGLLLSGLTTLPS